jgi:uncharacterized protein (TIGR00661 family)
MKILYAIQGTGNGHLCRAKDIYSELQKYGEVDLLISGYQSDIPLPFPVKYRLKGLSFIFGKHGGVSLAQTAKRLNLFQFMRDVYRLPVEDYDLVVNDFEPISAWACKFHGRPCVALSHQSAVLHHSVPKPKKDGWFGRGILKYYAPFSSHYGFHFNRYDSNVFLPVIRKEVQELEVTSGKHYTVYLPAYDAATLIRFLSKIKKIEWQVFCKHSKEAFQFENISVFPVSNDAFLKSLSGCKGALLGAGFEGPAETLYLKKKLMVVPMMRQIEQQCNAAALEQLGIPVIPSLQLKHIEKVNEWILNDNYVEIPFSKETATIAVSQLMHDFVSNAAVSFDNSLFRILP